MPAPCTIERLTPLVLLFGLALLMAPDHVRAQPVDVPDTWGGDFWSRPRLTGDWGGLRDDLGKKGVVFDTDLLLTPQDVASGGKNTGGNVWGNVDYTLNVDTGKLGLWPGGFFKFEGDTGFGNNAFSDTGSVVPVNTAALFPGPNDRTTALTNATFMQFLSTKFGLFAGKINTLDLGSGEFTGDYHTQFLNTGLVIPLTLALVPLSAFGGGVIGLPTTDITLSAIALDPNGTPTSDDLGKAFSDGVTLVGTGQVTIRPLGLVGHQNLGFSWSNEDRVSLDQSPANIAKMLLQERFPRLVNPGPILGNILARFFPSLLVPATAPTQRSDTWSILYSFDQYFWQPDGNPKHGIGAFFSFGVSDGNPNPVKYAYAAGIGGKGVVPGREDDSFGLGFTRTQFSDDFVPFLRQNLNLGLEHVDAMELYYNAAVTQWLNATADLQVVTPGLTKSLVGSGLSSSLTSVSTAVVIGGRIRIRF
jgi:porin